MPLKWAQVPNYSDVLSKLIKLIASDTNDKIIDCIFLIPNSTHGGLLPQSCTQPYGNDADFCKRLVLWTTVHVNGITTSRLERCTGNHPQFALWMTVEQLLWTSIPTQEPQREPNVPDIRCFSAVDRQNGVHSCSRTLNSCFVSECVFTYVLQQSVHCEWLQPPIHILSSCGQHQKGRSLLIVWKYTVSCPAFSPRLWEQGRKWPEEALRKLVSTWKHSIVTCWPWQCMQDDCAGCRMCGIGNGTTLDAGAIINTSHATSDWTQIHDLKLWNSRSTFSPDSCESFIWCIPCPQLECPPAGMDETSLSIAYNTCAIQTQPWKVIGRKYLLNLTVRNCPADVISPAATTTQSCLQQWKSHCRPVGMQSADVMKKNSVLDTFSF